MKIAFVALFLATSACRSSGESDTPADTDAGGDTDDTDADAADTEEAVTPAFSFSEPTTLVSGAIFPGIVHDGDSLVVSYAKGNDLFLRRYTDDWDALGEAIAVTNRADVTDHKHLFLGGSHYLAYSTFGDTDLYLIRLDADWVVVGETVAVAENSSTTRTNDMLLGHDGANLVTGQFRPPDLNGGATSGHLLRFFDPSTLEKVGDDVVANFVGHANTAATLTFAGTNAIVAPSGPVPGGDVPTQRDLLLLRFGADWGGLGAEKLVDSSTLTHDADGDGIWMSTGIAYDEPSGVLLVGHTFVEGGAGGDAGQIFLRAFDPESGNELYSGVLVDETTANRAHFLLRDDTLFVVYDEGLGGAPSIRAMTVALHR